MTSNSDANVVIRRRQGEEIRVPKGTNLRRALVDAGFPVASSCDGEAVCAKCVLKILEGSENLSPPNRDEEFLKDMQPWAEGFRLSCQVEVLGDVTVDARYW